MLERTVRQFPLQIDNDGCPDDVWDKITIDSLK